MIQASCVKNQNSASLFAFMLTIQSHSVEKMWLGGSAARSFLVGSPQENETDIDLLFFNKNEQSKSYDAEIEAELIEATGIRNLSVKNQARMGFLADGIRYQNLLESVSAFPDVTVALAACIGNMNDRSTLVFAPYGLPSQRRPLIRPTSRFLATHGKASYIAWLARKKYEKRLADWTIDDIGHEPLQPAASFYRYAA